MSSATIKSKQSGGLNSFLKKKDPNLDSLKEKYFAQGASQSSKSAYKPADTQFSHYTDVENFIEQQSRKKQVVSLRQQLRNAIDNFFLIKIGNKSLYFWHSRRFEEFAYMHIPRFLFLAGSIYSIYTISLRQR